MSHRKFLVYSPKIIFFEDGSTRIWWSDNPQCSSEDSSHSIDLSDVSDETFLSIHSNVNKIIQTHGKFGLAKYIASNIGR
jgi:hypothetical protein